MCRSSCWRHRIGQLIVLTVLLLVGSVVSAEPNSITQQGRLTTESGQPMTGQVELRFALYDKKSGGAVVWEDVVQTDLGSSGFYSVDLGGEDNPLDPSVLDGSDLWVELTVDGKTMSPRIALNAVPYAVHAQKAQSVAKGAVSNESISSVDWSKVENVPSEVSGGGTLGKLQCQQGDVALYAGNNWACSPSTSYGERMSGGWFWEAENPPNVDAGLGQSKMDATASGGSARFVSASATAGMGNKDRAWAVTSRALGTAIGVGRTQIVVRAKVANASSSKVLARAKCRANDGQDWQTLDSAELVPDEFPGNQTWKTFLLECDFSPSDANQMVVVEDFQKNITDLSVDFGRATPGTAQPSVDSEMIKDGVVQTTDLKDNSVTSPKIKDGEVKGPDLASDSVGSSKIKDGEVRQAEIKGSEVAVYRVTAAGCSSTGNVSTSSSCRTTSCNGTFIYDHRTCSGSCRARGPQTCPNTKLGYLLGTNSK